MRNPEHRILIGPSIIRTPSRGSVSRNSGDEGRVVRIDTTSLTTAEIAPTYPPRSWPTSTPGIASTTRATQRVGDLTDTVSALTRDCFANS